MVLMDCDYVCQKIVTLNYGRVKQRSRGVNFNFRFFGVPLYLIKPVVSQELLGHSMLPKVSLHKDLQLKLLFSFQLT